MPYKDIRDKEVVCNEWLKLMFYFEHELCEGEITERTYGEMTHCLMVLKNYLPGEDV